MKDDAITNPFYVNLQKEINKAEKKADLYTILFYLARVVLILLAGAITILSALEEESKWIIWLGVITTVVTASDTLFQIDNKKNTYKLMLYDLRNLRAEIVHTFYKNQMTEQFLDHCFQRYNEIKAMGRDLIGSDSK